MPSGSGGLTPSPAELSVERLPAAAARRLFLGAQGLLDDPDGPTSPADLLEVVTRLGFVQLDSIRVVAHAHDLTLLARRARYRPEHLAVLAEEQRAVFEAFTHDASWVPTCWYPYWKRRFRRDAVRIAQSAWWRTLLGEHYEQVCAHVLERVAAEGALGSADFDHPEKRGPWWGWKPQKAALDYLWRSGRLAVSRRVAFHKRYDLPERVLPAAHASPEPDEANHVEWACVAARERLGVFTATELAAFFGAVDRDAARTWCDRAVGEGRIVPVLAEAADGSRPQSAFALADWQDRLAALPEPPRRIRLMSPFDPVVRDRKRALRRFGFDYRFEAFTPAAKRVHGYYVMPLLEGDALVGRLDAKLHRSRSVLEVRSLSWERTVRATRARQSALRDALERLAAFLGARDVEQPASGEGSR